MYLIIQSQKRDKICEFINQATRYRNYIEFIDSYSIGA